jgi:3-hydroxybutyryl-CoA dehydrogenase
VGEIRRVGVVGSGLMGSGIAEVCARAGLDVLVGDISAEAVEAGRERVTRSLGRAVRAGKLSRAAGDAAMRCLRYTSGLGDFADRELVLEAVTEREQTKAEVLAALDKVVVGREAIFGSNTSSIPIMRLATATRRAPQVIGIHFFNPAPVLSLVELIPSLLTSEETYWRAEAFVTVTLGRPSSAARTEPGLWSTRC